MKKIISLMLVFVLCFSHAAPALAAETGKTDPLAGLEIAWVDTENALSPYGSDGLVVEYHILGRGGMMGMSTWGDYGLRNADGELIVPVAYGTTNPGGYNGRPPFLVTGWTGEGDDAVATDYLGKTWTAAEVAALYPWNPPELDTTRAVGEDGTLESGKWYYADPWTGEIVLPAIYDRAYAFYEGVGVVTVGEDTYAIDRTGETLFDLAGYDFLMIPFSPRFVEERMAVRNKSTGKYGYLDHTGAEIIPAQYDGAANFSEGLAAVKQGDSFGYIDTDGNVVVPCVLEAAGSFSGGVAVVRYDGRQGILKTPLKQTAAAKPFLDVPADAWYSPYVDYVAGDGIMIGTGDGAFSPTKELTRTECLTLALRLYDRVHGGDGVLEKAPEDWGLLTLTCADGESLTTYGGGSGYTGQFLWVEQALALLFPADEADWTRARDGQRATVRLNGQSYEGTVTFFQPTDNDWAQLSFLPDRRGGATDEALQHFVRYEPGPDKWWRDAYYTANLWGLETNGDLAPLYWGDSQNDQSASREEFANALYACVEETLPVLNDLYSLPDTEDPYVLTLYRSGILQGMDAYGTFAGDKTLTRAEAAAMVARVLDPDLRLTFTLSPLPTEGYTLTYLADGTADTGVEYPVLPLAGVEGGAAGLLTLDGRLLPWPGNVPSFGLYSGGGYLHVSCWNEDTEAPWDLKTGMLDAAGEWVVPMGTYDQVQAVKDGFLAGITGETSTHWYLLDKSGQVSQDLGTDEPDWNTMEYPELESYQGIHTAPNIYDSTVYLSENGVPVSQKFDWASKIGPDGSGFVGLDGKIYCIQFQ